MASLKCLLGILAFCGLCILSFGHFDHDVDLITKAHYHFQELQKSLERVSSLQKRSSRIKRDVHLNHDMKKSDFLFESLLDLCFDLQNFGGASRNVTTTVPTSPEIPHFNEEDDYWCALEVRPIGVTASRDGDQIHIRFYVKHSVPARISRFAGVKHEQIDIDFDESKSSGPKISSASFTVSQVSSFCLDEYNRYSNQFIFEKKDDVSVLMNLRIDVCKFDQYRNESMDWRKNVWLTKPGPLHENVTSSKIVVIPPSADGLVVETGKNQSLQLMGELNNNGYIYFYTIFYDRSTREFNTNTYRYSVGDRRLLLPDNNVTMSWRFLNVEEISSLPTEGNGSGEYYEGTWKVKLRIHLATESGRITGKLYISCIHRFGTDIEPSVVREVTTALRYLIKKPNKTNVFPRRKIFMEKENRFICTKTGNDLHEKFGRNCTVSCWASGRDLESLKIYRNGLEITGYGSVSHVSDDRIFMIIDLGVASPSLDGTYKCVVTDKTSFTKTQKINVYTYGFPKIDVKKSRVEDLGNGTVMVVCYVTGILPINVSVELHQSPSFSVTFDAGSWSKSEMETADGKIVQAFLPIDNTRFPVYSASCQATSDRGNDYEYFDLSSVVEKHRVTVARVVDEESGIVSYYDNLTTVVTCVASGRQPVDVWIAFGERTNRVDNGTDYTREEYKTEDKTTVRIFGDSRAMMQATHWLYCLTKNEYDSDYRRYNLWSYLDRRLIDT